MGGAFKKEEKKPKSRITEQDKAILVCPQYIYKLNFHNNFIKNLFQKQQLKQMRDKLKKYQEKIEIQMAKDRALAKELLNNGRIE